MITKKCDKCDRLLEYSDKMAGHKVECPHCGDVNVLPGPHSEAYDLAHEKPDRAQAAGYPPDSGPEQDVMTLRPAVWRSHPLLTILTLGIGPIYFWFRHWGDRIYITNKRTVLKHGFFSRNTTEVLHDHVLNIQIKQTFTNRIFKVGTIGISSAGQETVEIVEDCVPNPEKIKEIIDLYRPL